MFTQDGIVTKEMFESSLPSPQRRRKGPYAVMECYQKIPCNPCRTSCKFGALQAADDLNALPVRDAEKCTGCGACVSACPGLACFIIDETYSEWEAAIRIPYEMLPLPKEGEKVDGLNRAGVPVAEVRVLKVQAGKVLDKTNVVTIAVPKKYLYDIRNIAVRRKEHG